MIASCGKILKDTQSSTLNTMGLIASCGKILKDTQSSTLNTMGFTKQILKAGNGLKPQRGQRVTVHCTGFGKNNDLSQKFWSTKDPGQEPFTFAVGLGQGTIVLVATCSCHICGIHLVACHTFSILTCWVH